MHTAAPAFKHTAGPHKAKIVVVGEAWGESEDLLGKPFVGESGKELWRMLGEATQGGQPNPQQHASASALHKYGLAWVKDREQWLESASILFTNVLAFRPSGNKFTNCCLAKAELPSGYGLPPIAKDGAKQLFLHPDMMGEVNRLVEEIQFAEPNVIVALGNPAAWATLRAINITSIRGTVAPSVISGPQGPFKVIPTFHPAGVMRQWAWRPIVVTDLMKALREAEFPEIRRPHRLITINPTIEEVEEWTDKILSAPPEILSCDTETELGQIKMISFAPSVSEAFVVPFLGKYYPGGSYWPTIELEFRAWRCVRRLLESPIPKLWQNTLYDIQYGLRRKIRVQNCQWDPMLLHHAVFPEMQKGLGFLGSVYTNEASWKMMRKQKMDTEKRDE